MRVLQRSIRLDLPPAAAFDACLRLLTTPDSRRGVVERTCEPDPPAPGGTVISRLAGQRGAARELRSRIVELDRVARRLATGAMGDGPSVLVRLVVEADGQGSRLSLTSEVTAGLTGRAGIAGLIDAALFSRAQRRSARVTLGRVRELAEPPAGR